MTDFRTENTVGRLTEVSFIGVQMCALNSLASSSEFSYGNYSEEAGLIQERQG